MIEDKKHNALYILNHFEYDSDTLKQEYDRDVAGRKKKSLMAAPEIIILMMTPRIIPKIDGEAMPTYFTETG